MILRYFTPEQLEAASREIPYLLDALTRMLDESVEVGDYTYEDNEGVDHLYADLRAGWEVWLLIAGREFVPDRILELLAVPVNKIE